MTTRAQIIDGKAEADALVERIAAASARTAAETGAPPGLAVILVGADPASEVYVRNKGRAAKRCGFHSIQHTLPADASEGAIAVLIDALNADPSIHGVLVQLPLPRGLDERALLLRVSPEKDVDGFHPINIGLLAMGATDRAMVPCTPAGSLRLARKALGNDLSGLDALVIGRSNIVGKPVAQLLLQANCTVTLAHSRTRDLAGAVGRADLVIAAAGAPELVKGAWIKPDAVVIDVGVNRVAGPGPGETRLVGDVEFAAAAERARAITPVPGGVGPMTIAMLMANTLTACRRRAGLGDEVF